MPPDDARGLVEQLPYLACGRQHRSTEVGFVEPSRDATHRAHLETIGEAWLVADQTGHPDTQHLRERLREGRQENSGVTMRTGEVDSPMQRHDGLPGTGRAGDTGRTVVVAFHHASLGRMEKYNPALPRVIEGPPQLLHIGHHSEASLRVRVRKRVFMSGERCLSIRRDGFGTPLDPGGLQR